VSIDLPTVCTRLESESLESVDVFIMTFFEASILSMTVFAVSTTVDMNFVLSRFTVSTSFEVNFVVSTFVAVETVLLRLVVMIFPDATSEKQPCKFIRSKSVKQLASVQ